MMNMDFLNRAWPVALATLFIGLLLSLWGVNLYWSWEAWLKAQPTDDKTITKPVILPKPKGASAPLPTPAPKPKDDGCIIIDDIAICDEPQKKVSFVPADHVGFKHVCALHGDPTFIKTGELKKPRPEAIKALTWMTDRIGISANFELRRAQINSGAAAFAAIRQNKRYIVYDEDLFFIAPERQIYWQTLAVLGHEIGHHVAGHTSVRNQPPHERELEADKFAGFMLGVMGASLHQAQSYKRKLSVKGSKSHPPRAQRMEATRQGWLQAQRLKNAGQ